jgi:hypothetical protein
MWSMIRWLVLRFAALRWLFKLAGLGLFLPFAFLLKLIGLPILAVLAVVGLPIIALLFLFGLPVILVLGFGGLLMGLVAVALMIGLAALKIFIFIVLPIWLVWTIVGSVWARVCKRRGDGPDCSDDSPPAPPPTDTPSPRPTTGPTTGPIADAADMPPGAEPA